MGRYIVKRIGQGIVTMWLVTLGVFVLLRLTGDPWLSCPRCRKEDRAHMIAAYGLNKPLWQQYLIFNKNLAAGRFGEIHGGIRATPWRCFWLACRPRCN